MIVLAYQAQIYRLMDTSAIDPTFINMHQRKATIYYASRPPIARPQRVVRRAVWGLPYRLYPCPIYSS